MVGAPTPSPPAAPRRPTAPSPALLLLLALLAGLLLPSGGVHGQPCPAQCSCTGTTVDCHGQGLRAVPRNIPRNAERLDLNANNLTKITKADFAGLKHLRVLRLNRNNLAVFPELLFLGTTKLYRL
ncbi:hypothetical protein CRUP_005396 [Coryphaenoides rupestris]|nr:hypothetical protein CRUP_005396 [Coryphaenoides rupestris]